MTRFARAKGSKASNERAPEDATPWEVMKEQLVQAKKDSEEASKRLEAENKRVENYENFLKEQKTQKRQATWCDFPEEPNRKINKSNGQQQKHKEKKNMKKHGNYEQKTVTNSYETNVKNISNNNKQDTETPAVIPMKDESMCDNTNNSSENTGPLKKKKKKDKKQNTEETAETSTNNVSVSGVSNVQSEKADQENNKKTKKKNKNKQEPKQNQETNDINFDNMPNKNSQVLNNPNLGQKKKKDKKLIDGKPVRRKVIDDKSFQLIVNGKEVDLIRYDGFPIMKRDAERLEELKKNMIKKGIPKSEVQRTMKLERRRAEKALARLKRDVCYNCRKGGHNLSDCPELKTKIPGVDGADGVCFKCGSTEHRQFECKVQRDKEFRFATCFICKEQGHIARQCPDNPKGLYPNGGGCKLCGDVTHLRKDCPTSKDKKEESAFKLQTIDNSDNIEGISQQQANSGSQQDKPKKPKKIMF